MRLLNGIFSFVALIMFAGVATAKIDECQPDGMSDAEAARIIAVATEQGKAFRATIDAIRASGMSYETDTTYDDLMADPERAIALAKKRYEGRVSWHYSYTPEKLRERGVTLDYLFENRINLWVGKKTVNFFTTELTNHLQQLAIQLGGEPTESPYRYAVNADTFVFALSQFTNSAKLKYIWGVIPKGARYPSIQYKFSEEWTLIRIRPAFRFPILLNFIPSRKVSLHGWKTSLKFPIFRSLFSLSGTRLNRRKPNFEILIHLTGDSAGEDIDITLDYISFGGGDGLKSPWPVFQPRNEDCLATFTEMEN